MFVKFRLILNKETIKTQQKLYEMNSSSLKPSDKIEHKEVTILQTDIQSFPESVK